METKPWHSAAIQMRSQGLSYAAIGEQVGVPGNTVKTFLRRADGDRKLATVSIAPKIAPVVDQEQNRTLVELYTVAERTRVNVLHTQMKKVTEELENPELDPGTRLRARIEVIKALRSGATMPELEQALKPAQKDREIKGLRLVVVRPEAGNE